MMGSVSTPNPKTLTAHEYQLAIEVDLMSASGGQKTELDVYVAGLYEMTGRVAARVVEPARPGEYSREEVVAKGLAALDVPMAHEEAALHRTSFATLAWRAASLAVACHVDLNEAFGYTFRSGSFGGTIAEFDRMVADTRENDIPQLLGPFGWSLTIGQDTIEVYDGMCRDYMASADRAIKMKRPPRAEALTLATSRLLHVTSWILQQRLGSSLATAICKDFDNAR